MQCIQNCSNLEKLLKAEMGIIKRHIKEHKWYRHILDDRKATVDFIKEYGWIMKEMYCGYVCEKREGCKYGKSLYLTKDFGVKE